MAELQTSAVQKFPSSQTLLAPGTQALLTQASPTVHGFWSASHGAVLAVCEQPSFESQASSVQGFASSHDLLVPVQVPDAHASSSVQALPSSQDSPSAALLVTHCPPIGSHALK